MSSRIRRARAALSVCTLLVSACVLALAQEIDSDLDGVPDASDNCPAVANAGQENVDLDPLGDACDPYPALALNARPLVADFALLPGPLRVTYLLEDQDGTLRGDLAGIRTTLTLGGAARFADSAVRGRLLSGAGTNRAEVEFVEGVVEIDVFDESAETVALGNADTAGNGVTTWDAWRSDFEQDPGGYTTWGNWATWAYGQPVAGAGAAHSGRNVWATALDGTYYDWTEVFLQAPWYSLPPGGRPRLLVWNWFSSQECCDYGRLAVWDGTGAEWPLDELRGELGGWFRRAYDLSPYAGGAATVLFTFVSDGEVQDVGWQIDDVVIDGLPVSTIFLLAAADSDGDGIANADEVAAGTSPLEADTDHDGRDDGWDNCPLTPNPGQRDWVHPGGGGDACDDPDGDGVFDDVDNCPDAPNPGQADFDADGAGDACRDGDADGLVDAADNCLGLPNPDQADVDADGHGDPCDVCRELADPDQADADGDGLGDACDPYPELQLLARPSFDALATTEEPLRVLFRLEDVTGRLRDDLTGVRAWLTTDGHAVFGEQAWRGELVSGGGTNRVLVEFAEGLVELDLRDPVGEWVALGTDELAPSGVLTGAYFFHDMEPDPNGNTCAGFSTNQPAAWRCGTPADGAHSGEHVEGVGIDDWYPPGNALMLSSPRVAIPAGGLPRVSFWTSFDAPADHVRRVLLQPVGQTEPNVVECLRDGAGGWFARSFDLRTVAGREINVQWWLQVPDANGRWYVDDVLFAGLPVAVRFRDLDADDDGDGLSNRDELRLGTDPDNPDTDFDGALDAADNCPTEWNSDQADSDGNGVGDACDDIDGDGILDQADNCPHEANPGQSDGDFDSHGDICDNCPEAFNSEQYDWNANGLGDACEDSDGDGVLDAWDNCPSHANPGQEDSEADGVADACDNCPTAWNPSQADSDLDGEGDVCSTVGSPGPPHEPYVLPGPSDSDLSLIFDAERPQLYTAHRDETTIRFVDLRTGLIARQFECAGKVWAIAITRDASKLFAASVDWHPGAYLSVFDLASGRRERVVWIPPKAEQIAPLSNGRVLVYAGVGANFYWWTIDPVTGAGIGDRIFGRFMSVHPSERRAYLGYTRVDIDAEGRLHERWTRDAGFFWFSSDGTVGYGGGSFRSAGEDYREELNDLKLGSLSGGRPFEDTRRRLLFSHSSSEHRLYYSNLDSYVPVGSTPVSAQAVEISAGQLWGWVYESSSTAIRLFPVPHPLPDAEGNQPPEIRLDVTPGGGTKDTVYTLDASRSTDPDAAPGELQYDWDLDADGWWDVQRHEAVQTSTFEPGTTIARVRVRDLYGAASTTTATIRNSPATTWQGMEYLDAPVPDDYTVFATHFKCGIDKLGNVVIADMDTGALDFRGRAPGFPLALQASADGREVVVGLRPTSHAPFGPNGDPGVGSLWFLPVDPASPARLVNIAARPDQFALTPQGLAVVSTREEDSLRLATFDAATGTARAAWAEWPLTGEGLLAMHPSGRFVYVFGTGRDVHRFDIGPAGELSFRYTRQPSWYIDKMWISPAGDRLVIRNGYILSCDLDIGADLLPIGRVPLEDYQLTDFLWDVRQNECQFIEHMYHSDYVVRVKDIDTFELRFESWGQHGRRLARYGKRTYTTDRRHVTIDEFNHAPHAVAGLDQVLECARDRAASATLDGSGSWDGDSQPGTEDDIASYAWLSGDEVVGHRPVSVVSVPLGAPQELRLRVTDRSNVAAEDLVAVTVQDTLPPAGSITSPAAGACFGPPQLPVVVADDYADACEPEIAREYAPPGGSYGAHGDYAVTLTVRDGSGNASSAQTAFTIDTVAPVVAWTRPPSAAGTLPFALLFVSADEDGAAGSVVREQVYLDECLLFDGASWGDGDGLLSDETLALDKATLRRAAEICGRRQWRNPVLTVRVADCGGNAGTDRFVLPASLQVTAPLVVRGQYHRAPEPKSKGDPPRSGAPSPPHAVPVRTK